MPSGFEVLEVTTPADPPHLTIRWRRSSAAWFAVAFPLLLVAIIAWHLADGEWGGLLVAPVAAWLLVKTVARAVNTSTFRVDRSALVWSSEPIPLWGRFRIATPKIEQLFTVVEQRGRNDDVYCLMVKTRSGKERAVAELDTADQARWLEHAIERHLGIEDRPVEGELS